MRTKKIPFIFDTFFDKQFFLISLFIFLLGAVNAQSEKECYRKQLLCMLDAEKMASDSLKDAIKEGRECAKAAGKDETEVAKCLVIFQNAFSKIAQAKDDSITACQEKYEKCVKNGNKTPNGRIDILFDYSLNIPGIQNAEAGDLQSEVEPADETDSLLLKCVLDAHEVYDESLELERKEAELCIMAANTIPRMTACFNRYVLKVNFSLGVLNATLEDCFRQYGKLHKINSRTGAAKALIYPNPSTGSFVVAFDENIASINVLDYLGRNVKNLVIGNNNTIEVSIENPGVYFVEAISLSGTKSIQKVVVQ